MTAKKYVTIQGDMWDLVAKRVLGSELYMDKLIEANPDHQKVVIFSANVTLTIPEISIPSVNKLPPWKRGGAV